ncbi:MAG: hypothetical protein SPL15_06120 [Lachnospiraceae bacterium]|nr:hypothetical protein [Lachnospiraceae bacterium]MDY5742551.1 hypothetical protein [Lachnospiraceae bacterium]
MDYRTLPLLSTFTIVMIIISLIMVGILVALYFWGKKAEKQKAANEAQMESMKQTVNIMVIDKRRMRMKDANLPDIVMQSAPKLLRRSKLPILKAKVGPKIMTLICDAQVFEIIPLKKEVRATISGIYVTGVKAVRGSLDAPPAKKKGFFKRLLHR